MKGKTLLSKLKKNYSKLPTKLYRMNLSVEALALYGYLSAQSEDYSPSMRRVGVVLGVGRTRLLRAYKELESRNMIKCYHKGYKGITKKWEFVEVERWN